MTEIFGTLTRVLAFGVIAAPMGVSASETHQMVINRTDRSVEIFMTLPAAKVADLFGTEAALWLSEDDTVDLLQFQVDTADLGDAIFAETSVHVGDELGPAEAMSVMMHNKSVSVPFETPWDAITGVTLCSVPIDDPTPALEQVHAYLGYSVFPADGLDEVLVSFPTTGRRDMDVHVIEFVNNEWAAAYDVTLQDGAALQLGAVTPTFASLWSLIAAMSAAVALVGGSFWLRTRVKEE